MTGPAKAARVPRGAERPNWKGDAAGYQSLHKWVRGQKGEPLECAHCGATNGRIEWANLSREYRRDVADWAALCKRCHGRYDNPTCRRGHERTEVSAWIDGRGYPHCRTCRNERLRVQRSGASYDRPHRSAIADKYGTRLGR